MPVDRAALEAYVDEVAGGDAAVRTKLLEALGSDDAAVRFTGGFTRQSDYTRKTQEAAKTVNDAKALITNYTARLEESEGKVKKIMKDLADERISRNRAEVLLQSVKDTYSLSDEDIPSSSDLTRTANLGAVVNTAPDIDERLKTFEKELMKKIGVDNINTEFAAQPIVNAIQQDIYEDHRELTGKRLTRKEMVDLVTTAQKDGKPLETVWEEKYGIPNLRTNKANADFERELRSKWDKEQTDRRTQEALEGIRRTESPVSTDEMSSPLFRHKFASRADVEGTETPQPKTVVPRTDAQKEQLSGAEKAAENWVRRRTSGVRYGDREPEKGRAA